jgi:hypothetical protein
MHWVWKYGRYRATRYFAQTKNAIVINQWSRAVGNASGSEKDPLPMTIRFNPTSYPGFHGSHRRQTQIAFWCIGSVQEKYGKKVFLPHVPIRSDDNLVVTQDGEVNHRAANWNVDRKDSLRESEISPPSPELVANKPLPAKVVLKLWNLNIIRAL